MLLDDSLQLVANHNIRHMLYTLKEMGDNHADYEEVTGEMVERDLIREEEIERFEVMMSHNYLPKMAESGVVDYDNRSGEIRYVPDEDMERLLEFLEQMEEENQSLGA